jgi:hypothetical protein
MKMTDSEVPPGLRRGGLLAAGSIAASVFTTLCSLSATVLILRYLANKEAGRFAFLVELLYTIGLLGSLGQSVLQARIYQQRGAENFDWARDVRATISTTAPFIAAGVLAVAIPYRLTMFEAMFLILGAALFVVTNCFSAVLGQQRRYAWSSALLRLGNGLLIIPAALMVVSPSLRRMDFVLVSLVGSLAAAALLGTAVLARSLPRGQRHISIRERVSGLVFLASLLALVVPQRGLIVVAGALLEPGALAALAAVISILRVFDLVGESAGRVFSTEMARNSRRIGPQLHALPWILAALLTAAVLIALPPVVHRFYSGRYDIALPLLPWLVAAAAFRLIEIVPRGFLAYLAPARLLHRFAAVQCAAAVGGIVLMVIATTGFGMKGLVSAAAAIAAARLGVSYLFLIPLGRGQSASARTAQDVMVEPLEIGGEEPPI